MAIGQAFENRGAASINFNAYKAVTPNDLVPVFLQAGEAKHAAALYIGTAGDLAVTGTDGVTVVFKNVPAGTLLQIHAVTVNSTNTTASNIVALFRV